MLARAVHIELRANACLDCGHVELSADPANLKALAIVG
jgi:hypothetical protein